MSVLWLASVAWLSWAGWEGTARRRQHVPAPAHFVTSFALLLLLMTMLMPQYNDVCWKTAPDNALDTVFPKVRG